MTVSDASPAPAPSHARASGATCAHCGLPARGPARGGRDPFCCVGCELAWHLSGRLGDDEGDRLLTRIVLGAFLSMGVMVASLSLYGADLGGGRAAEMGSEAARALTGLARLAACALALPVVVLLGLPLAEAVTRGGRWLSAHGLVLLGSGAALALSLWHTVAGGGQVYFETVAMVLVLVSLGRWLDARSRERARRLFSRLARESTPAAVRVEGDGERKIDPAAIAVGDRLRVRPGEPLPVDGRVLEGRAFVDASSLTGEERPRAVVPGDRVLAGTTPLDGALLVEAEAVAGGLVRDRIEALLEEALASDGRLLRLADRVARAVMAVAAAIALVTLVVHGLRAGLGEGLLRALAVMLISCPCALGIATPLAFWGALAGAWRRGVLIRGSDVLERLARARRVVFDKTGTLTEPVLELARVELLGAASPESALELAAALELGSEHPLGASLRCAWLAGGARRLADLPAVTDFAVRPGVGVCGRIGGELVELRRAERPGSPDTVVELVRGGVPAAAFHLESRIAAGVPEAVAELRARGLDLRILTGDSAGPARRAAERLGVPVEAELLPQEKLERVRALGERGTVVVGDGLNDAAALAAADVGIAVAGASPRSVGASEVSFVRGGVPELPALLSLARGAVSTARWNLAWAFSYNVAGWWLAATGRLTPVFAAAAMAASSVIVVVSTASAVERRRPRSPRTALTPSAAGS